MTASPTWLSRALSIIIGLELILPPIVYNLDLFITGVPPDRPEYPPLALLNAILRGTIGVVLAVGLLRLKRMAWIFAWAVQVLMGLLVLTHLPKSLLPSNEYFPLGCAVIIVSALMFNRRIRPLWDRVA